MMWAIASVARDNTGRTGGHPLWHQMVVAGAAVGVFVAIKLKEHWDRNQRPRLALPTGAVLALALCSAASAAIHATVSCSRGQTSTCATLAIAHIIASARGPRDR